MNFNRLVRSMLLHIYCCNKTHVSYLSHEWFVNIIEKLYSNFFFTITTNKVLAAGHFTYPNMHKMIIIIAPFFGKRCQTFAATCLYIRNMTIFVCPLDDYSDYHKMRKMVFVGLSLNELSHLNARVCI